MADPGSVAYNFSRKGVVSISKTEGLSEDDVLLAVLEADAEEVIDRGGGFEVITEPSALVTVRKAVQAAGIDYDAAEAEFLPTVSVAPSLEIAQKVLSLVESLEDCDDVQTVFTNMDLTPELSLALEDADQ
jgi:transcriptional/translational regulatory protein YebC/TACO1